MPGHSSCSVVGCKNNWRNYKGVYFRFPSSTSKVDQKNKWINLLKRKNKDGTPWDPKPNNRICDAHFVGNKISSDPLNPSYVPSIFPTEYKKKSFNPLEVLNRHARFMGRQIKAVVNSKQKKTKFKHNLPDSSPTQMVISHEGHDELPLEVILSVESSVTEEIPVMRNFRAAGTQVNFLFDIGSRKCSSNTFICNRLKEGGISEAETQTEIFQVQGNLQVHVPHSYRHKSCGTDTVEVQDKCVGTDKELSSNSDCKGFEGYESIEKVQQLIDLAGVDQDDFGLLLKRIPDIEGPRVKVKKNNRLLIFLMIMKTGITFSAAAVLFGVHRSTVSKIFHHILGHLACTLKNFVYWPSKDVVQDTMPECFKEDYGNTRVIIDCTEFRIEIPRGVDNKVFTYSNYKKGFTGKVLIGMIPGGLITFKSKMYGGRTSDCEITVDSGLLELLEDGDVVLADKGFPEVQAKIDAKGRKAVIVLPPFLRDNEAFTEEETTQTYNIARVRIHVERIMQRLRTFQILSKIPVHLFDCADDIITVCCVLVNLQPCVIAYQEEGEEG